MILSEMSRKNRKKEVVSSGKTFVFARGGVFSSQKGGIVHIFVIS